MEFYEFVDRFQEISKVKIPAVSKAKAKQLLRAFKWKCFAGIWWCHIDHALLESVWYGFTKFFQTQPSCPRNICTEHWRKLSNLTEFVKIFSYFKNINSVEYVSKILLIVLFIYFQGKRKFSHWIWSIWLFSIFIFI